MADIKAKYGSSNQAITITINGLANDAKRESTAVDNSVSCFTEALVQVKIATNATADSTGDKSVHIYAYGTADDGTTCSGNAAGSDAAFGTDPQQIDNCRLIGIIYAPTQNKIYESDLMGIASAFGGQVPQRWGIVVHNKTGQTLKDSDGCAFYQGLCNQSS
ncbi:MAG: hypothetical protein A2Y77_12585 [Planctomycetes bacterium RBG_13_62_9]|nr:MAG: hypothetical protein A2Y77_12585 [Planctomycetes bacterium RBG_13_62_9]